MLESLSPDQLIGLLAIVAVVSAALAYLVFALRHSRKTAELQNHIHALELSQSGQEQQLQAALATESRLTTALDEQKQQILQLNQTLEKTKQQLHQAEKQSETAQANYQSLQQQFTDKKAELQQQIEAFQDLQQAYQSLSNQHTELKTTLERREEHFKEQMAQLADTKQSMTKEFENLANKIFEEKGKTFTDTSKSSIDVLLKPFREQIEGFQKRINEVHDASIKGNTNLNAEIKKVLDK